MAKLTTFDIVDSLDSEEAINEYISQVFEDGDSGEIIRALGHVARARGMTNVAATAGVGRESLYKALFPGAKPRFDTILRVIRALGIRLQANPRIT